MQIGDQQSPQLAFGDQGRHASHGPEEQAYAVRDEIRTAEESLASENLFSTNFGPPTSFMDPRRAMVGVRLNLGQ